MNLYNKNDMEKKKNILDGLDHRLYEHPFDKIALEKLESVPFLSSACRWITENTIERVCKIQYTGSNIKVTNNNYPKIYEYLVYSCKILGLDKIPELYIQWSCDINACTIGAENPIIVITSGLIDLCKDDEIIFVISHEIGHIRSNHMLYHMLGQVMNYVLEMIPGSSLLSGGLKFSLFYWCRMSEFTADRAGLLACQNIDAAISLFIKIAGLPKSEYCNINLNSFIEQAKEFKMLDLEGMNKMLKLIAYSDNSHPWTVVRAAELLRWIETGAYNKIFL